MADQAEQLETGLPPDWEVRMSNSKNLPYYFDSVGKTSRWEPPPGTDTDKLKVYMATYHSSTLTPAPAQQQEQQQQQQQQVQGEQESDDTKIRAAHLLVKHCDSRRPKSWKEDPITRTMADAEEDIKRFRDRIRSGSITLGELAVTESDCSSARKRGDLGFFGRGDMQKEFEEAAFKLQPGEMSDIVKTASGLHLIERLE